MRYFKVMTAEKIESEYWKQESLLSGLPGHGKRSEFFVPVKKDGTPYKNFSAYWPSEMVDLKYEWSLLK